MPYLLTELDVRVNFVPQDSDEPTPSRPTWPAGWPIPRVGDRVQLAGNKVYTVDQVRWLPEGHPGKRPPYVSIYLVPGPL